VAVVAKVMLSCSIRRSEMSCGHLDTATGSRSGLELAGALSGFFPSMYLSSASDADRAARLGGQRPGHAAPAMPGTSAVGLCRPGKGLAAEEMPRI
jgi:hypothetical protein